MLRRKKKKVKEPEYQFTMNKSRAMAMLFVEFPHFKPWLADHQEMQRKENEELLKLIDQIVKLEIDEHGKMDSNSSK